MLIYLCYMSLYVNLLMVIRSIDQLFLSSVRDGLIKLWRILYTWFTVTSYVSSLTTKTKSVQTFGLGCNLRVAITLNIQTRVTASVNLLPSEHAQFNTTSDCSDDMSHGCNICMVIDYTFITESKKAVP